MTLTLEAPADVMPVTGLTEGTRPSVSNSGSLPWRKSRSTPGSPPTATAPPGLRVKGISGLTNYGKTLMQRTIEPMIDAITKFIADATKKPGPKHLAVEYLQARRAGRSRLHHRQGVFDGITSMRSVRGRVHRHRSRIEEEVHFRTFEQANGPLFRGVKKNLESHPLGYQQRVRSSMLKHTAKKFEIQFSPWAKTDKLHLGSKLIDLFIESVGS
jgi:hypothetical protein